MQPARAANPSRRRRRWLFRVLLVGIGSLFALTLVEIVLHVAPGLLPAWFRERYPPHGVEFFDRGVLDRTPLDELPLPYGVTPYDGPPPHDLVDKGIAPPEAAAIDRARVPRLVLPADADGLPNVARPQRPDLCLVGDSFTVFAAQKEPPGLQARLEVDLGATVLNLGVAGIGPDHQLFLLRHIGMPSRPRCIVWFFYGGNDLVDVFWVRFHRAQGNETLADLFAEDRAPRLILPALLAAWLRPEPPQRLTEQPLAPFRFDARPDTVTWFHPDNVRFAALDPEHLDGALAAATATLRDAHELASSAGVPFLLVFVPSKEQVCLPHVAIDAAELRRLAAASTLYGLPMPAGDSELLAAVTANRDALERRLEAFCSEHGVPFWSATPVLEELAARGEPGYYCTDTHWHEGGQQAVAAPLIDRLHATAVFRK